MAPPSREHYQIPLIGPLSDSSDIGSTWKTIGELAIQFGRSFPECRIGGVADGRWKRCDVVRPNRARPWAAVSRTMPRLETADVSGHAACSRRTDISEGRGTSRPFELSGAPGSAARICRRVEHTRHCPVALIFVKAYFPAYFHKYADRCAGRQLHVTDRDRFFISARASRLSGILKRRLCTNLSGKPPPYEYEYRRLPIEVLIGGPSPSCCSLVEESNAGSR